MPSLAFAQGEKGLAGGYVTDAEAIVPAGAYITVSTVYNGRRWYIGIDTVQAKLGKDTLHAYDKPCYAALWVAGGLYSPTGAVLADKNYRRTVKSLWIEERCRSLRAEGANERYLALGTDRVTYTPVVLTDTAHATMWFIGKDDTERNKYIQGFLYDHSDATGVDIYRYLTYDPLYGFSHAYESRPANSQRLSVWDRRTGSDVVLHVEPESNSFGLNQTLDTVKLPIRAQAWFFPAIDHFRSRYDQRDIHTFEPDTIKDQSVLADPAGEYRMHAYYEWSSHLLPNPADPSDYDGNSYMPYWTSSDEWKDSTLFHMNYRQFYLSDGWWLDTIYAIGHSPFDAPSARFLKKPADGTAPAEGDYTNHKDWLHVYFNINGVTYVDSAYVIRYVFHNAPYTTLALSASPEDHLFPYTYNDQLADGTAMTTSDVEHTFTIAGRYKNGNKVMNTSGTVVTSSVGEEQILDIAGTPCHRDTVWILDGNGDIVLDGGGNPTYSDIVLYDTLLVEALNPDGTPCTWIESVSLPARNQVKVRVNQYNPSALVNRTAQLRVTYRYWRVGIHATDEHVIWITQEWSGAHESEMYSFTHRDTEADGLQATHEKHITLHAIPGEPLSLPLHYDLWGYYRWFIGDGAGKDRDVQYGNTWQWVTGSTPTNANDGEFMLINHSSETTSRGRWDVRKDVNTPANPLFDSDHFTQWTATHIPAVEYPEKTAASLTKSGKVACDVSEYYDVEADDAIGSQTEMTEPVLGYRHVFDIQPAKTRADEMAVVKGNGSGANWMEVHNVVAPASREFKLQPKYPIAYMGAEEIDEEHLQYIYYANPTAAKIGTREDLTDADLQENQYYARIGKKKQIRLQYHLNLLTYSDLTGMRNGDTKRIILVNPKNGTGFLLGRNSNNDPAILPLPAGGTTKDNLKQVIEDKLNDGGTYNSYLFTIGYVYERHLFSTDDYYYFSSGGNMLCNLDEIRIDGVFLGKDVRWGDNSIFSFGDYKWGIDQYNYSSYGSNLPTGFSNGDMVSLWFNRPPLFFSLYGYLTYKNDYTIYCSRTSRNSSNTNATTAWLIYEVEETEARSYEETPQWEKYNGSSWTRVAHWNYAANGGQGASVSDVAGYTMGADGSLQIGRTVHTAVNETIRYRLRTEHFQLARFTIITRSADGEILKNGDIISEEDMERDYDIIYKLDMETWPAPNTDDVVAYNYHFPWDFTEMAYHLPLSAVPAAKRVFGSEMPGKGEYAFINKFVVPEGPNTSNAGEEFECLAGAAHGYMLCVNAAQKRTTIMNFIYDQLSCSGQQIYLVGNYCNPVQNGYDPQITADLEGTNDGITWTPLYRYKSGKIPYNHENPWYQMALPIDREHIRGYSRFRCRAEIDGTPHRNAHLLIDRLRFIERSRGFSVFQNKATCIREDSVTALIRINYQASPELYQPGKLIAYQFQKWDETANSGAGGYVPLAASQDNGNGTYTAYALNDSRLEIYPGYIKDGFTATESVEQPSLKSVMGYDYGYVLIPETDYDPSASSAPAGQSAYRAALIDQALTVLGITGSAATTRKADFLNETANIRTFDQVVAHDYSDFVTVSFGGVQTPHIKSFVNVDGTWLLYIVCRLPVSVTDNNTFRIGMTVMNNLNDHPTFTEESCATFRILNVKHTTGLLLDGAVWPNYTRAEIEANPADDKKLLAANETYRASISLTVKSDVGTYPTYNPRCKFDLLHADGEVRANDAAFIAKYGCSRTQFVDDMEAFRIDDERNVMRDMTDWSQVTPEMFTRTGRDTETANAIYNRLNHLIRDLHVLELGLDYRDIYMGDKADSWFYLLPVPATGLYDVNRTSSGLEDTTMNASVCNDTLWLELHTETPTAKLRFGYDSRVGDTYIVPVIRASRTDARTALQVRVAEMWTQSETDTVVLGWNATELIDSDDPDWTGIQVFRYSQDKDMRTHTPNATAYYGKGDTIIFTPQAEGNTITLKAGCRYQFRTPFYAVLKSEAYPAADPLTPTGHAEFVLAIAPDTARWTPSYPDRANYWNDDANWTAVVNGTDRPDITARVPMGDTHVIIPQAAEGLLPIVSDVVTARMDTLEFGYAKNTCRNILFRPRSQMLGQEKLEYEKAFVDVLLTSGTWQTFSPALSHIYAGDMYVPADPATADASWFAPGVFSQGEGSSWSSNPRVWPYAVYQGFYNSSVSVDFYNTDYEGTPVDSKERKSKNSVDWVKTNKLDMPYHPGAACVLNIYGPSDEDGEEIVVRLPKQEASYRGYGKNPGGAGYIAGPAVPMGEGEPFVARPAFGELEHNLAYDKTGLGSADGISYTLTNEIPSEIFFFGNPTMSLVDVYTLCRDNEAVLQHEDGTYRFTAYQLIDGTNYIVKSITGEGQYFIAPQRAVGLIAKEPGKSLTVRLKPGAMVALTGDGIKVSSSDITPDAPVRRAPVYETPSGETQLHIAAAVETTDKWGGTAVSRSYLTLGESAEAHDGFVKGEDALSIASGLNYYSAESFSTPLSLYTIADNRALMFDMRSKVSGVPLVFTTLDESYTFDEYTLLSFAIEGGEGGPFYLCDALTGDSVCIVNGMQIAVRTPQSDQLRYFINGSRKQQTDEPETPTDADNVTLLPSGNAASGTVVYDMLGRCVLTLGEYDRIDRTGLPTGVYLIYRGGQTQKIVVK